LSKQKALASIREIIFGLEDGIVSTLGVITGVAGGTQNRFVVILTGLVVICVESLSMAAGVYMSNKTEEDLLKAGKKFSFHAFIHKLSNKNIKNDAKYMWISYIIGGSIPLSPYIFLSVEQSMITSIIVSVFGLVGIGYLRAKVTKKSILSNTLETIVLSLGAAGIGYGIGKGVSCIFPQL
jgi:predicted membrane protein (TIGR00267 family)